MNFKLYLATSPPRAPGATGTARRSSDAAVDAAVRSAVWHRDCHVCRFCGFRSQKHQDVLVWGGNVRDVDGMATVCQFCRQCLYLPEVVAMRSGVLIWLPELTQEHLHHVAREIYLARITTHSAVRARKALDRLMARRESARQRLGTDDPKALCDGILGCADDEMGLLSKDLRTGTRLLPLDRRIVRMDDLEFNQFPQVLAFWRSREGPYRGEKDFAWITRLEQALETSETSSTGRAP